MATQLMDDRSVSFGRIFSRAFGVMGSNPIVVFGVSFLLSALPFAVLSYFLTSTIAAQASSQAIASGTIFLFALVPAGIALVLNAIVQGTLVSATVAYGEGRQASFGQSITVGLARVVPLIVVSIVYGLAVGLGSLLLLVPGILAALVWAVATPVVVAERSGIGDAFSRSAHLTKGARWKIFGLFLVMLVILILVSAILQAVTVAFALGVAGGAAAIVTVVINALVRTISSALFGTWLASLYVELRNWKDGPEALALGDIFA